MQKAEGETTLFSKKLLDYESISGQSICFLCEATKMLTGDETETFFKPNDLILRPRLF